MKGYCKKGSRKKKKQINLINLKPSEKLLLGTNGSGELERKEIFIMENQVAS